jgi:hypothetical protein
VVWEVPYEVFQRKKDDMKQQEQLLANITYVDTKSHAGIGLTVCDVNSLFRNLKRAAIAIIPAIQQY